MKKIKPYIQVYKGVLLFPYPARRDDITCEIIYLNQEWLKRRIDFVIKNRTKLYQASSSA